MADRRKLGKKIRFEVFKRDRFTCQYCGRKAPDVILEVDHINPVCKGGKNSMTNLVTSCRDCNRGKGKIELSDDAVVSKQNQILDGFAEKREQLEMLSLWHNELLDLRKAEVDMVNDYITKLWNDKRALTEYGKELLLKMITEFSYQEVMDAIQAYPIQGKEFDAWFLKLSGVCHNRRIQKKNPQIYYFNYLRKACKANFGYVNEEYLRELVMDYIADSEDFEQAKLKIRSARNWTQFTNLLSGHYGG